MLNFNSLAGNLSAGQGIRVTVGPFSFFGTPYAGGFVAVSQATRLYFDPETSVLVSFEQTGGAGCAFAFGCASVVRLSGYLVTLP